MSKRSMGLRSQTRKKFRKSPRDRGKRPVTRTLQKFEEGESVNIVIDPSFQKGQPHHRFHGFTGVIVGMQGVSYFVEVKVGGMRKKLVIRPEHLRKAKA